MRSHKSQWVITRNGQHKWLKSRWLKLSEIAWTMKHGDVLETLIKVSTEMSTKMTRIGVVYIYL